MNGKPESLNILGITYKITYCDNPSEVDLYKRESCWGEIDYWTRSIRIYDNGRSVQDIWKTIIHEVLHGIGEAMKLDILDKGEDKDKDKHEELDILALALADTLFRNDLIKLGNK
jgi:hypothetical protein